MRAALIQEYQMVVYADDSTLLGMVERPRTREAVTKSEGRET